MSFLALCILSSYAEHLTHCFSHRHLFHQLNLYLYLYPYLYLYHLYRLRERETAACRLVKALDVPTRELVIYSPALPPPLVRPSYLSVI
ncbi:hypothetical protein F5141DRAFT_1220817 [Pisolithus sp. B1]|nr:hypothetical protein F5141DRAFT_1220817 [Pisolithus sp. B1]